MGAFLAYVIQSSLCLALLFVGYRLLRIKRETFYRFNRVLLLGICVLSFLLPWWSDVWTESVSTVQPSSGEGDMWLVYATESDAPGIPSVSAFPAWQMAVLVLYVLGCCVLLVKDVVALWQLGKVVRGGRYAGLDEKRRLVLYREDIAPFSWMGHVVMSEADWEAHGKLILAHELGHIRSRHSWDMVFISLCVLVLWFNPFIWLLKRELQEVHEYEADEAALHQGVKEKQYQLLLIEKAVGTRRYSMANSFNHSSLKKRITMMKKKKSSSWAYAKYLYVLPLAACAMAAFARPEVSAPLEQISNAKITDFAAILEMRGAEKSDKLAIDTVSPASTQEGVFDVVEQMPQFPGGNEAMMKFVTQNLKYPTEAHQKGIRGNVIVRFVVREDGTVTDAEVVRHADPLLEAEALRVVSLMPRWKPGRQNGKTVPVRSSLPVVFRLDGDSTSNKSVMENAFVATAQAVKSESSPLFVIDGREAADDALSKLAPADIESISILKGQTAREFYGDRGADGAVLLTTKRHAGTGKGMDKDKALILCDGQPITGDMLEALLPERIERIEVIKDSVGRARYGAFDREGVILVTLKKNSAD